MARILISNDDGIDAAGINALAAALNGAGEVWVVAPDRERSATSQAISLHQPLRIRPCGERRFAVSGTPADAVYMALNHLMPAAPDLVVSGINHGANLGNDILYSGTVGAAMEGALFGTRAVAVSLVMPGETLEGPDRPDFAPAAAFLRALLPSILAAPLSPGVVLNVNVPNVEAGRLGRVKLCRLGYTDWNASVIEQRDPRGRPYVWIGGERQGYDAIPDSDNRAIREGVITITPIHYDLTDHRAFAATRALRAEGFEWVQDGMGEGPLAHPAHPRGR